MQREAGKGFGCAGLVAIIFLAMIGGVVFGVVLGTQETGRIAAGVRKEHPNDPLDGLGIIFLGDVVWGWLMGTAVGVGLALAVWLKTALSQRQD